MSTLSQPVSQFGVDARYKDPERGLRASEILPAVPLAAGRHIHLHTPITFIILLYFDALFSTFYSRLLLDILEKIIQGVQHF